MKTVRIAELKARLSHYLRAVKSGQSITVLDRDTPVARLVPASRSSRSLVVRRPPTDDLPISKVPLPPPLRVRVDVVELLLEERQVER